jgi:hypothetical protein
MNPSSLGAGAAGVDSDADSAHIGLDRVNTAIDVRERSMLWAIVAAAAVACVALAIVFVRFQNSSKRRAGKNVSDEIYPLW